MKPIALQSEVVPGCVVNWMISITDIKRTFWV